MRKYVLIAIVAMLGLAGVVTYYSVDPSHSHFFPRCVFLSLTGYKCPGCGSQRALHSLLNGDMGSMFRYNAMFFPALVAVAVYGVGEIKRTAWQKYYATINSAKAIWSIFGIIVIWWVARNIFGW